jgi:hypothetical protein
MAVESGTGQILAITHAGTHPLAVNIGERNLPSLPDGVDQPDILPEQHLAFHNPLVLNLSCKNNNLFSKRM